MFFAGFVVFLGVLLLLAKLPRLLALRLLRHDLLLDAVVSGLVLLVHFGTFSGVMAATIAGLMTSIATSGAKRLFGYVSGGRYYPGIFTLDLKRFL